MEVGKGTSMLYVCISNLSLFIFMFQVSHPPGLTSWCSHICTFICRKKRWRLEDFDIGKPLGRGESLFTNVIAWMDTCIPNLVSPFAGKFGSVYLAREKKSKFVVALKVCVCNVHVVIDQKCNIQLMTSVNQSPFL